MVNHRRPPLPRTAGAFPSRDHDCDASGDDLHTEPAQPIEHEKHSAANVEDMLAIGRRHTLAGDLPSATQQFQRAVELAPRSALCKAELGRALVRQGKPGDGFSSLVAAFEIDSLCPGVKDGFLEYYRAEIEADPTNIGLHEGLAALSVDSGRPAEAAACYRRCLDLAASPSPASGQVTDSVRIDRWSVALFKCHASLCDWDDWNAEARALRAAVRRRGGGEKRRSVGKEGEGGGGEEGLGEAVTVTSSPPPRLHGSDRALLLGLELLPGERQGRHAALWSNMGTEGPNDTGGGAVGKAVGETAREAPARSAKEMKTATATENGGPAESPSLITAAFEAASAEAATDAANEGDVSRPALHPFDSLSAPLSIGDCFAVAQQQSRAILAEASGTRGVKPETSERDGRPRQRRRRPLAAASSRDSRGRVRLGFVSGDLMGTHPLTHLMQSTFGMIDPDQFEVFLYALNPDDGSAQRRRMEKEVEHFRDLSALTALEAATAISQDGVGVLVNLNGYAGTAKSADIFALGPAAVAVSYMGFPGTMGSSDMVDYVLADGIVIPKEMRRFYAEKVLEMPNCYFVNDYRQSEMAVMDAPAPNRADHALPPQRAVSSDSRGRPVGDALQAARLHSGGQRDNRDQAPKQGGEEEAQQGGGGGGDENRGAGGGVGVVLCNFNRLHKIDPHTFGAWMEVLRTVPGTVLWLLDGGETARANLRRQARLAGVHEDRIVFAPIVGKEEHLQRLRLADLFVDTPLYNAHTVGCDALWAGVPMITLRGVKMASRVGASLVEAAGMPELVVDSLEEYTRLVQALARDDQLRHGFRDKLGRARRTCPLFDTRRWVRDAEDALRWAWERHESGLPPAHRQAGDIGEAGRAL
eukprot:jgi/Undpi1/13244/HiC_scaffold_8.g02906.m1